MPDLEPKSRWKWALLFIYLQQHRRNGYLVAILAEMVTFANVFAEIVTFVDAVAEMVTSVYVL